MGEGNTPPENAKILGFLRSYALHSKSVCEREGGGGGGRWREEGEGPFNPPFGSWLYIVLIVLYPGSICESGGRTCWCTFGELIIHCIHCCYTQLVDNACYWWERSYESLKTIFKHLSTYLPRYFSGNEKRKWRNPVKLSEHRNLVNTIINFKCNLYCNHKSMLLRFANLLYLSGVQDDKYVSESNV